MRATRRALLAAPFVLPVAARSQSFPDRPLRMIVAFPAGTVTDTLARNLADPLGRELGQPVIVDNRPGGNGVVGTEAGARAAADGHTLTILSLTNAALAPYMVRRLSYDPLRDFAPIGFLAETVYVLVVPAESPARNLREFIALARERPGELTYSYGNNSARMASATLADMAGVRMTHVPYRGGPEALTDVLAGRIDSTFTDFAAALPQIREGRIRALGVTLGRPFPLAPDIPPVADVLPGYEFLFWFGLSAPAGTPASSLARLSGALNKVLSQPELAERLGRLGYLPRTMAPEEWQAFLRDQVGVLTERARAVGLEPQ